LNFYNGGKVRQESRDEEDFYLCLELHSGAQK
jgi:hypothetical protein